jgi:hydrogenase small subunit
MKDEFYEWLEFRGISRRAFLQYCAGMAATLSLSPGSIARALESPEKTPAIWLSGQDCAGCTISFTGALYPRFSSIILDKISLRYHETIMAASGYLAESAYDRALKEGGYILLVEGSAPGADDRFCTTGGRPFREFVIEAGEKAAFIIAVGACSSYGGIPRATVTKGVPCRELLPNREIVHLSSCPVHKDHLVGSLLYILATGKVPPLDDVGRPKMYFGVNVHDNCRRRAHFDNFEFLNDWNDPSQKDWCLYEKGCKGPDTYADMPIRKWNDRINFCIDCGGPCQGCAEPAFYAGMTPLYTAESERSRGILARKKAGLIARKEG